MVMSTMRADFTFFGLMVGPEVLLSALLSSFNGYLFSKWKFRGSILTFSLNMFGMFIPSEYSDSTFEIYAIH
jgi:ABC-type glycerol-3-phosphate transport system permease component